MKTYFFTLRSFSQRTGYAVRAPDLPTAWREMANANTDELLSVELFDIREEENESPTLVD